MGSDNLFHRRKAKRVDQLARRKVRREPCAKVLIVCEGEKTEPLYLNDLKDHYGLNSANVEICGECGSDPRSIFDYAKRRYLIEKRADDPFSSVYCVFDRDNHAHYQSALDKIGRATPKNVYKAITSVPCFEYWLLLHFCYSTKSYEPLPGNSACKQLISELKKYLSNYEKGSAGIFLRLKPRLDCAKRNAARVLQESEQNHTDNPGTRMHELVQFLQDIKSAV